jgi:hypothetical protein
VVEPARPKGLDEKIGAREQFPQESVPWVGDDRALAGVEELEEGCVVGVASGPIRALPKRVALRGLDLDDVSAQIAKQFRAVRTSDLCGAFDDAEVTEDIQLDLDGD